MTEKDQAIRLLNDMHVRWLDAADGCREQGIIYADQLLRDATDEIDNVRAVLTNAKPKPAGCCDSKCTGACDGNPSTSKPTGNREKCAACDGFGYLVVGAKNDPNDAIAPKSAPFDAWWERKSKIVRIIKHGKDPKSSAIRTKCTTCKTVFEFDVSEATLKPDQRDGDYYEIVCPVCEKLCTKDAHSRWLA